MDGYKWDLSICKSQLALLCFWYFPFCHFTTTTKIRWATMNLKYIYTALVYIQQCVTHALNRCQHGNYACPTDAMSTKDLKMGGLEEGFDLVRCCYSVKLDYELPGDLTPQQLLNLLRIPFSCSLSLIHPIENSQLPPIVITNLV